MCGSTIINPTAPLPPPPRRPPSLLNRYNKLCAEFGCTRDFVCIKPPPVRLDGGAVKEGAVTSPDKEAMAS